MSRLARSPLTATNLPISSSHADHRRALDQEMPKSPLPGTPLPRSAFGQDGAADSMSRLARSPLTATNLPISSSHADHCRALDQEMSKSPLPGTPLPRSAFGQDGAADIRLRLPPLPLGRLPGRGNHPAMVCLASHRHYSRGDWRRQRRRSRWRIDQLCSIMSCPASAVQLLASDEIGLRVPTLCLVHLAV